jgi:hypothetical protein
MHVAESEQDRGHADRHGGPPVGGHRLIEHAAKDHFFEGSVGDAEADPGQEEATEHRHREPGRQLDHVGTQQRLGGEQHGGGQDREGDRGRHRPAVGVAEGQPGEGAAQRRHEHDQATVDGARQEQVPGPAQGRTECDHRDQQRKEEAAVRRLPGGCLPGSRAIRW